MRLVQVARALASNDAINNEINLISSYIKSGHHPVFKESLELFEMGDLKPGQHPAFFTSREDDVILLHYGIEFNLLPEILCWNAPVFIMYHNITPAEMLMPYDILLAGRLERARVELRQCIRQFRFHFAASCFSAQELEEMGAGQVQVRPVIFQFPQIEGPELRKKGEILFVGRIFPNKNLEDLIKIFYFIKKALPIASLTCIGSLALTSYSERIFTLTKKLGLDDSVSFMGSVDSLELYQAYARAELYITCSLHEGFGVPVLEAMAAGVPVLARGETQAHLEQKAALYFTGNNHALIAELALKALLDQSLREELVREQKKRLKFYNTAEVIHSFLGSILQHV